MTTQLQSHSLKTLYDTDFHLWLESHINLLKNGKLHQLDLENLIEELESIKTMDELNLWENLKDLLIQLLKYQYLPQKRSRNLRFLMIKHRKQIKRYFKNSPSLKSHFNDIFQETYEDARELSSIETQLLLITFPLECPFTQIQVLDEDFLPE